MSRLRRNPGLRSFVVLAVAVGVAVGAALEVCRAAEPDFPFDRVLLLDAAPMRPAKRKSSLTITRDGAAAIDLWCKSVEGRVDIAEAAIKIVPAPLPEALPDLMTNGQCTLERMRADDKLLDALSQVGAWRRQGSAVVLSGPVTLRFYPSTN